MWEFNKLVSPLTLEEQYESWYAQFGVKDFVLSVSEGRYERSSYFNNHFKTGSVEHLFRARRFYHDTEKEISNDSFAQFCQTKGIKVPDAYRKVKTNLDAGFKNVSKYDREQPENLDQKAWALAGEWTKIEFQCMNGTKILSQELCINELNKTSSCGYPWNRKWHTKAEMIEAGIVQSVCASYWANLVAPVSDRISPIFNNTQKVELREKEKIAENKFRTFTAAPVEHTVNLNRFCLSQNNRFYDSHNKTCLLWDVQSSSVSGMVYTDVSADLGTLELKSSVVMHLS